MDGSGMEVSTLLYQEICETKLTLSSLTLPLPRRRLDGCACHSPLAHFHIHHAESSIREIHPFTTITHLASQKVATPSSTSEKVLISHKDYKENIMIQFLFRKSQDKSSFTSTTGHVQEERKSKQWTNKLAGLVEEVSADVASTSEKIEDSEGQTKQRSSSLIYTSLRLEGPYFTPVNPASYDTVICLVAGTGITGAIAIAAAFSAQIPPVGSGQKRGQIGGPGDDGVSSQIASNNARLWKRCIVVWSVRESDYIKLPFFQADTVGLEVRPHLTGPGHDRLDALEMISQTCSSQPGSSTWVYISGPNPFIEAGETACRTMGVPYFGARWT